MNTFLHDWKAVRGGAVGLLLLACPAVQAAITWVIPTSVESGVQYTVYVYDPPSGQPPPDMTVRLYKNNVLVAQQAGGLSYTTTDTGAQTVTYRCVSYTGAQSTRTVAIVVSNTPPFGWFDSATEGMVVGQPLSVWGWAADNEMGAPVARVDVLVDGVDRGDATLGGDRGDVATAYGRPDYRYSGWNLNFNTTGLSLGIHTSSIVVWDSQSASANIGSRNFIVTGDPQTSDSDGDGMVDAWEQTNGLNYLNDSDALLDADGDGLCNLAEFLAGRNPHEDDESGFQPSGASVILKPPPGYYNVNRSTWVLDSGLPN